MTSINFKSETLFHKIDALREDEELINAVTACISKLRDVMVNQKKKFKPNPNAKWEVSEEALEKTLALKKNISDIRTNTDLSNCLVFHTTNLDGSIINEEVMQIREQADRIVADRVKKLFSSDLSINVKVSGHFLYPKTGYMGWHTNLRKPGWRFYVTHSENPGNSFFRYRNPDTGEIITSTDDEWDFRLFQIVEDKPLWHSVYSDTNRWSLGYMITLEASN